MTDPSKTPPSAPGRVSKIGEPGTPERERWVAGCVMRDLDGHADNPDDWFKPEVVRPLLREGAEAIRRLLALSAPSGSVVDEGVVRPDVVGWLKGECNRYVNGHCSTRSCLLRGGYDGTGSVSYDIATCEAHEALTALRSAPSPTLTVDADDEQAEFELAVELVQTVRNAPLHPGARTHAVQQVLARHRLSATPAIRDRAFEEAARVADPPLMHRKGAPGLWRRRRAQIAADIRALKGTPPTDVEGEIQ